MLDPRLDTFLNARSEKVKRLQSKLQNITFEDTQALLIQIEELNHADDELMYVINNITASKAAFDRLGSVKAAIRSIMYLREL